MNVSIRQLRAFVTLSQCDSFAEACEQLHISQPALSSAIKNMESEVGGKLFARTTRHLELTPEGLQFLPGARRLLADWEQNFDDLDRSFRLQQGRVQIAAMPSFATTLLPQALAVYRSRFPGINISVQDVIMEQTLTAVRDGQADLGITFQPENLEGVEFEPLFKDRFIAIVGPDSPLREKQKVTWQLLCSEPFIAMNRGSWSRTTMDEAMSSAQAEPAQLLEASQLATIGRMVAADLGVSVVPSICRHQMTESGCICLPLINPPIERKLGIFTSPRHPPSQAAQALADILRSLYTKGFKP